MPPVSTTLIAILAVLIAATALSRRPGPTLLGAIAVLLAAASGFGAIPFAAVAVPIAGLALLTPWLIGDRRSLPAVSVVIGLAAAAVVASATQLLAIGAVGDAYPEYLRTSVRQPLASRAGFALLLGSGLLLLPWPLSTLATAAGKGGGTATAVAIWSAAALTLLSGGSLEIGLTAFRSFGPAWVHVAVLSHLFAALLAVAHSDLRTKLVCLGLGQTAWTVGVLPIAVAPEEHAKRWAAAMLGLLAATRLVEALITRYGRTDQADYRGLIRRHAVWSAMLIASLLLACGPLPVAEPSSAAILLPASAAVGRWSLAIIVGGAITAVAVVDLIRRLVFGPLDRPVFEGPLFPGVDESRPDRPLLTMRAGVLIGLAIAAATAFRLL